MLLNLCKWYDNIVKSVHSKVWNLIMITLWLETVVLQARTLLIVASDLMVVQGKHGSHRSKTMSECQHKDSGMSQLVVDMVK